MSNTRWYKRAKETLLSLSRALSFDEAMKEWKFTGRAKGHINANQVCELCGKKNLRNRFKIMNELNGNVLNVGSSCIKKFHGIEIRDDDGQVINDPVERKRQLDRQERSLRKKHAALQPLRHLYLADKDKADHRQSILNAVEFYQTSGYWPHDIVRLFARMDNKGIDHDPSSYKIQHQ